MDWQVGCSKKVARRRAVPRTSRWWVPLQEVSLRSLSRYKTGLIKTLCHVTERLCFKSQTPFHAGSSKKRSIRGGQEVVSPRNLCTKNPDNEWPEFYPYTRWDCRYHIAFSPKFRRKLIYGRYRRTTGGILKKLCEHRKIEIAEAKECVDHIHTGIKIPPKYSVCR